jgi:hypothetical protein
MSVQHSTVLRCDLCPATVTWESGVSITAARQAAKQRYGWRKDKLGRDVCPGHPRLNQKTEKEK